MSKDYYIKRKQYFESFEFAESLISFLHENGQFGDTPLPSREEARKIWDEAKLQKAKSELNP